MHQVSRASRQCLKTNERGRDPIDNQPCSHTVLLWCKDGHSTKTVRVEIRCEFRGGLVCCRERHVSVGPHQIERVSTHSGARHSRLPREFMKRQTTIAA